MWTYINSADCNKDRVRYYLGDVMPPGELQDEDILMELEEAGCVVDVPIDKAACLKAAASACQALMAKYASQCDYTIGPEKVLASQKYDHFTALQKQLEDKVVKMHRGTPELVATDPGEGYFNMKMHDAE